MRKCGVRVGVVKTEASEGVASGRGSALSLD